jgi:hypothetical protein
MIAANVGLVVVVSGHDEVAAQPSTPKGL